MNNLKVFGKFLDQPILVSKFQKTVPAVLIGGAGAFTAYDLTKTPRKEKGNRALYNGIVLGSTVVSALAAPHIASKIAKRPLTATLDSIKNTNKLITDEFKSVIPNDILEKSKEKILSFNDVKCLFKLSEKDKNIKSFLDKLIPEPKDTSAKDIFSEIGYLSVYGAVPVIGGITGGIIADKFTSKNIRKEMPNKIKEGFYQYFANIFMCNIGAGIALGLLEKAGIRSKAARAVGMTTGIIITGIVGGSKIANYLGSKLIDPIFNKGKKEKERTPEVLDIGLHTDDIATVSLLSGLKWIEPTLPALYAISGYRAGTGYRN